MASTFTLTLDTTAPSITSAQINDGAAYTSSRDVTFNLVVGGADVAQMKVWGDVDVAFDANVQATEGASAWVTYDPAKPIRVSTGDGTKTLNVKVRDDVGNATAAAASDTITLDTTVPVITISVAPSPTKISKVAGFDTTTFQFSSDSDLTAWKVKVVPATNSLDTAGTTIGTASGSTNVTGGALGTGVNQTVTIKGADVEAASAGDGAKIIKVFGQEASGGWST